MARSPVAVRVVGRAAPLDLGAVDLLLAHGAEAARRTGATPAWTGAGSRAHGDRSGACTTVVLVYKVSAQGDRVPPARR